jgi:hypothetical protein
VFSGVFAAIDPAHLAADAANDQTLNGPAVSCDLAALGLVAST